MIFPIPEDYSLPEKMPGTHALLVANVLVFFMFFWGYSLDETPSLLENKTFLSQSEKYYHNWYLFKYKTEPNEKGPQAAYRGLTNPEFMKDIEVWDAGGDYVEYYHWRNLAMEWKRNFTETPISTFGLKSGSAFSIQWLTYQFSHSDLFHLLSNMCFLFVLGLWIEKFLGTIFLLNLYLLGGFVGALLFCLDGPSTLIPMVGASGSVSALIAFIAFYRRSEGLRYFFLMTPFKGWYGIVYFPAWLLIPLYMVSDVTGYLVRSGQEVAGIAHSAHIGGALVGMIFGLLLGEPLFFRRRKSSS